MKIIFAKISSCIKVFNFKKLVCPFFIHKVMFIFGYYNEITVVKVQIVCKLVGKDSSVNPELFHMIN